jgi:hypothetical protein
MRTESVAADAEKYNYGTWCFVGFGGVAQKNPIKSAKKK